MDVPDVLKDRGAALWRELAGDDGRFEFDAHEVPVLMELCRALDRIDELQAALDDSGLMIAGSAGQLVLHPAVSELRQQQVVVSRLTTQLNLGDAEAGGMVSAVSAQARSAVNARWGRSKGARRA